MTPLVRLPGRLFANHGAFADLYGFIEADSSLSDEDFMDGVLDAFETDRSLYIMPYTFSIETLVGKAKNLKGCDAWKLDDYISFARKNSDSMMLFNTRKNIFDILCISNLGLIGSQTESTADNCILGELLNYAKSLPEDYPAEYWDEDARAGYESANTEYIARTTRCSGTARYDHILTI